MYKLQIKYYQTQFINFYFSEYWWCLKVLHKYTAFVVEVAWTEILTLRCSGSSDPNVIITFSHCCLHLSSYPTPMATYADPTQNTSHTIEPSADDAGKKKKTMKRRKVNHACLYCRRSHMTCDEGRPCQRWWASLVDHWFVWQTLAGGKVSNVK